MITKWVEQRFQKIASERQFESFCGQTATKQKPNTAVLHYNCLCQLNQIPLNETTADIFESQKADIDVIEQTAIRLARPERKPRIDVYTAVDEQIDRLILTREEVASEPASIDAGILATLDRNKNRKPITITNQKSKDQE